MKIATACLAVLFSVGVWFGPGHAETGPSQDELNAAHARTDWLLPNHDYAGQRFVDLQHITRDNASQLRPVCLYNSGDLTSFPTNPLVYDGVMYITTGNVTVALDAATCVVRWRHDWKPKAKEAHVTVRGVIVNPYKSRGAGLKSGKLIRSTSDGHLIALDATTGTLAWEKLVSNAEQYELLSMAPLIYEDLAIIGVGISEFGIKGWIGAFRLADGERV
jgi:alcohol dehydrogenase (cytochrome c)